MSPFAAVPCYLVFSSRDLSVITCFYMVKYVCILQNIITYYLSKTDKLIKTRMTIIPSYVTHNLMGIK